MSPPSKLADDYREVILPIDESFITEANLIKMARLRAVEWFPGLRGRALEIKAKELRDSMIIEDPEHRNKFEEYQVKKNDEVYGVFCSSMTIDNAAQWEGAACLSTGFVVGLNLKSILTDPRIFGIAGKVEYYDKGNPPKVQPFTFTRTERLEKASIQIFNVPNTYSYEDEFRIFRTNRKTENDIIVPYAEEDRKIRLSDNHLDAIYIGKKLKGKRRDEFISCCSENFPNTEIRQN